MVKSLELTVEVPEEDAAAAVRVEVGGWETPKRAECRIPAPVRCPEPPRKKPPVADLRRRSDPPKNGYFHPPDLEALFAVAPRREASCA